MRKIFALIMVIVFCISIVGCSKNKEQKQEQPKDKNEQNNIVEHEGVQYVNDEIVIVIYEGIEEKEVELLAKDYNVNLEKSMSDIGVYNMKLKKSMSYEELTTMIEKLKEESIIEDAYINTVIELGNDEVK